MKMLLAASVILLAQYQAPAFRELPDPTPPSHPSFIYQPPIYIEPIDGAPPFTPQYQIVQPGSGRAPAYVVAPGDGSVEILPPPRLNRPN
jgi:hypothetical protein